MQLLLPGKVGGWRSDPLSYLANYAHFERMARHLGPGVDTHTQALHSGKRVTKACKGSLWKSN